MKPRINTGAKRAAGGGGGGGASGDARTAGLDLMLDRYFGTDLVRPEAA